MGSGCCQIRLGASADPSSSEGEAELRDGVSKVAAGGLGDGESGSEHPHLTRLRPLPSQVSLSHPSRQS